MEQFYDWSTATYVPVNIQTIDIKALSDAIKVAKNVISELGFRADCQQYQLTNVQCQTGMTFRQNDDLVSIYNIGDIDAMYGVIMLNRFPGINRRELGKLFSCDRYINDTFCINCLSATDNCSYIATIVLFPDMFDRDALVHWFNTCSWKQEDNVIGIASRRAMQIMEEKYHMETAEEFCFEERD